MAIKSKDNRKETMTITLELKDEIVRRITGELMIPALAIIGLVPSGMSNKEIGKELCCSEQMVKNYLRTIYDSTGMGCRVELVLFTTTHPELLEVSRLARDSYQQKKQ